MLMATELFWLAEVEGAVSLDEDTNVESRSTGTVSVHPDVRVYVSQQLLLVV
jgi:hypothetical protein